MHIDELARQAAAGADAAGGKAVIFGTITVSDGISMGTPGMRYSLTLEPDPGPFDPDAYFDWLLGARA